MRWPTLYCSISSGWYDEMTYLVLLYESSGWYEWWVIWVVDDVMRWATLCCSPSCGLYEWWMIWVVYDVMRWPTLCCSMSCGWYEWWMIWVVDDVMRWPTLCCSMSIWIVSVSPIVGWSSARLASALPSHSSRELMASATLPDVSSASSSLFWLQIQGAQFISYLMCLRPNQTDSVLYIFP